MARYTGPQGKIARRLGFAPVGMPKTQKILAKRRTKPGMHGASRTGKQTEFGKLLTEKQKMRFSYCIMERQFRRLFDIARRMPGMTGDNLFKLLETRLDTVVFRMRLAASIMAARQLVRHGHIKLNGKKATIPSIQLRPGDTVEVKEASRNLKCIQDVLTGQHPNAHFLRADYVTFDGGTMKGQLVRAPERSEVQVDINEQLVVEFYNR